MPGWVGRRRRRPDRRGADAVSVIFSRAPLRISLGGGGTDLPSYYREHGGFLVSGAIDKYVYMLTHTVFQRRYRMKYSELEEVDEIAQIRHPILRESLLRHWRGSPLEIASVADVPAGHRHGLLGRLHGLPAQGPGPCASHLDHARRPRRGSVRASRWTCSVSRSASRTRTWRRTAGSAPTPSIRTAAVEVEPLELDAGRAQAPARSTAAVLHRRGALGLEDARRPGRALAGGRGADDREPAPHQGAGTGRSAELLSDGDLDGYAELMHEHWEHKRRSLAGDVGRAHRPALHARAPQRRDRRQAGGRRRRRIPARLQLAGPRTPGRRWRPPVRQS